MILRRVDCVTVPVPDLESGLAFYRDRLGHGLTWRNARLGQAGLAVAGADTEIVLSTDAPYAPAWQVDSADATADLFAHSGGRVIEAPRDIPVGRLAIVEDPFGNVLVLLDLTKGRYRTDAAGDVTGVEAPPG